MPAEVASAHFIIHLIVVLCCNSVFAREDWLSVQNWCIENWDIPLEKGTFLFSAQELPYTLRRTMPSPRSWKMPWRTSLYIDNGNLYWRVIKALPSWKTSLRGKLTKTSIKYNTLTYLLTLYIDKVWIGYLVQSIIFCVDKGSLFLFWFPTIQGRWNGRAGERQKHVNPQGSAASAQKIRTFKTSQKSHVQKKMQFSPLSKQTSGLMGTKKRLP